MEPRKKLGLKGNAGKRARKQMTHEDYLDKMIGKDVKIRALNGEVLAHRAKLISYDKYSVTVLKHTSERSLEAVVFKHAISAIRLTE